MQVQNNQSTISSVLIYFGVTVDTEAGEIVQSAPTPSYMAQSAAPNPQCVIFLVYGCMVCYTDLQIFKSL